MEQPRAARAPIFEVGLVVTSLPDGFRLIPNFRILRTPLSSAKPSTFNKSIFTMHFAEWTTRREKRKGMSTTPYRLLHHLMRFSSQRVPRAWTACHSSVAVHTDSDAVEPCVSLSSPAPCLSDGTQNICRPHSDAVAPAIYFRLLATAVLCWTFSAVPDDPSLSKQEV